MVKKVSNSNERLRELMEILNLKQSDIVRRTGISKISEPFGISPAWLMGYDVPMKMEINVEEPNSEQRLLLYMLSLLNEEGCSEALKSYLCHISVFCGILLCQNRNYVPINKRD